MSTESFLNLVDNKLKDHQQIAPDPTQFPDSWYITRLNCTLEPHTTLYQFIVSHQMQADAIARHTGTPSTAVTTYESHLEHVQTFCQMIDYTNRKLSRRTQGIRLYRLNLNELMDVDGMAGEKGVAVAVAVVTGRAETLGMVGNLKDEEGALVGGTITGFLVNSLINRTMSHMHSSSGIVLQMANWLPTTQKLPRRL